MGSIVSKLFWIFGFFIIIITSFYFRQYIYIHVHRVIMKKQGVHVRSTYYTTVYNLYLQCP